MKWLGLFLVGAWLALAGLAQEMPAHSHAWFTNYTAAAFQKLPMATNLIDPAKLNRDLLDAAVLHETNERRRAHGLPPLAFSAPARQAARLQSQAMAQHAFVGHGNPNAAQKTMADRARLAGLQPQFLAENVASTFARDYRSGEKFYVRDENGRTIYSRTPTGPMVPMRSYIEAAKALLDNWMNSPGHRENILHRAPAYLGTACEPEPGTSEMAKLYCTQVFFTPLTPR